MQIDRVAENDSLPFAAAFAEAANSAIRCKPTPVQVAFLKVIFVTAILVFLTNPLPLDAASSSRIPEGDIWSYLIQTGRGPSKWTHIGFDDSKWPKGASGFGFGGGRFNTRVDELRGPNSRIFVRHDFTVRNAQRVRRLILSVVSDGPFVAHINGIEMIRNKEKVTEAIDISGFAHELFPGTNVIAIETFAPDLQKQDFSFIPLLEIVED